MELNLKRSNYYHRPVYHTEIVEFPDYTTKFEQYYKDDELIQSIEYYENGLEKSVTNYENGMLNGYYSESNENGFLKLYGYYRKGLKNGRWSYYNSDAFRIKYEKYYMGELIESETYHPD